MAQRPLDIGVAEPGQALAGGPAGGYSGEALFHVTTLPLDMSGDAGIDCRAIVSVQIAAGFQMVGQTL